MRLKYAVQSSATAYEPRPKLVRQRPIPNELVGRFCEYDDGQIVGVYEFTEDGSFSSARPSFYYKKGNRLRMRSRVLPSPEYYRAKSPASSLMRQSVLSGYWTYPRNIKRYNEGIYFRSDGTYTYTLFLDDGPPPRIREYIGKFEDWPSYRGGPNGWNAVLILPRRAYAKASGSTLLFDPIYDEPTYSAPYHFEFEKSVLVIDFPREGTKRLGRCEEEAFHVSKI